MPCWPEEQRKKMRKIEREMAISNGKTVGGCTGRIIKYIYLFF